MLIFDIETKTYGKPNPEQDIFKYLGAYDCDTHEYIFTDDANKIKALFKKHKIIIGFNSKFYDEPILRRFRLMNEYHNHIDLLEIIRKRETILECKNESKSLDNLAIFFKLSQNKMEFDYSILNKDKISEEEYIMIRDYTLQDIKVTKELFEYLCNFFESFKEFLNTKDIESYKWLTCSISVYAYKVICNLMNEEEEYDENKEHIAYPGGFVADPIQDFCEGNIYCLDFNSIYPHNMIQGNLFSHNCSCCSEEEKWKGNELFPIIGKYCSKKRGKIEDVVQLIYNKRKELKKNKNKAQFALKIVINTLYGLTGNPSFKKLYNYNTAYDCTLIGRSSVILARKMFKDAGYLVLYSDTDSVFIKDIYNDKDRLIMFKTAVVNKIKSNLPFPTSSFDMSIDAEIKYIWFFKKNGAFLKKHYIYVDKNNRLTIKGLPMIKSDSSKIGLLIFNKYMKEKVINGKISFRYEEINKWLIDEIKDNIQLIARTFKVLPIEMYKTSSQLQYQISKRYGSGKHKLIPNRAVGVGLSTKYCLIDEFKKMRLSPAVLILDKFWSEMEIFSNYTPKKSKNKNSPQLELSVWGSLRY